MHGSITGTFDSDSLVFCRSCESLGLISLCRSSHYKGNNPKCEFCAKLAKPFGSQPDVLVFEKEEVDRMLKDKLTVIVTEWQSHNKRYGEHIQCFKRCDPKNGLMWQINFSENMKQCLSIVIGMPHHITSRITDVYYSERSSEYFSESSVDKPLISHINSLIKQ